MAKAQNRQHEILTKIIETIRSNQVCEPPIHRVEAGKHLMNLANIAGGALIFGQAFSGFPFSARIALLGVSVMVGLYLVAVSLMKGGDN